MNAARGSPRRKLHLVEAKSTFSGPSLTVLASASASASVLAPPSVPSPELSSELYTTITRLQEEVKFLCGLLGRAKGERDECLAEIAKLAEALQKNNNLIEKLNHKTLLEEQSFRKVLLKERKSFDERLASSTLALSIRSNLLVEWAEIGSSISILHPDVAVKSILLKTCETVPKAREASLAVYKSFIEANNEAYVIPIANIEKMSGPQEPKKKKSINSSQSSHKNVFSSVIEEAKFLVLEDEREDDRDQLKVKDSSTDQDQMFSDVSKYSPESKKETRIVSFTLDQYSDATIDQLNITKTSNSGVDLSLHPLREPTRLTKDSGLILASSKAVSSSTNARTQTPRSSRSVSKQALNEDSDTSSSEKNWNKDQRLSTKVKAASMSPVLTRAAGYISSSEDELKAKYTSRKHLTNKNIRKTKQNKDKKVDKLLNSDEDENSMDDSVGFWELPLCLSQETTKANALCELGDFGDETDASLAHHIPINSWWDYLKDGAKKEKRYGILI